MHLSATARLAVALPTIALLTAAYPAPPKPLRGTDNAACRNPEPGPAVRLRLLGLKDRAGKLRIEIYDANDTDFLASDKDLLAAGKTFKRIELPTPQAGVPVLCIRAPHPGTFAVAVLHDRDSNGKFSLFRDGVAFPGNPRIGSRQPKAAAASIAVGNGVAERTVTMQYLSGFHFAPLQ